MIDKLKATFWSTPKRQTISTFALATLVFAIMSWAYIGNSLFTCGGMNIASSEPGDGTAGLTWLSWINQGSGPLPGFTHLLNSPFGETLRDPFQITSMVGLTGMWIFTAITGSSICAWNLMVLVGFMSSAMAMFAFIRWLTKNSWVAYFAASAVTFTPFHQFKSHGHLSYMFNAFFVLAIWAFIVFWRKPTLKNAGILAVTTALCAYQDGYFLLLGGTLVGSVIVGALLADSFLFKKGFSYIIERVKGLGLYILATLVLVAPIVFVQLHYANRINSTLASTRGNIGDEASTYGARPIEYILPADNHPALPQSYSTWRESQLHGSNFTENTLFLGFVSMALAVVAWTLVVKRKALRKVTLQGLPLPFILAIVSFGLICAFFVSLSPVAHIFGVKIPMPSWFIIHITAVWRVFSRLYLIVDMCVVILASIGLWLMVRKWDKRKQIIVVLLATAIALFELLTSSNRLTWNYHSSPAVYDWLRTQQSVDRIAEYPLTEQPSLPAIQYLTYQQIHGKALLNSSRTDSPQRLLRGGMQGLEDAQTLPILRTLGVDLVLSHGHPASVPGLQYIRTDKSQYNDDIVYTYKVLPGQKADYALVASEGFHLPETSKDGKHGYLPMGSNGVLAFQGLTKNAEKNKSFVHVSLSARPAEGAPKDQLISFTQQGVVRWQGVISEDTDISFEADPSVAINVIPYKSKANTTLDLYNLSATIQ